jgi:hypothetical protein
LRRRTQTHHLTAAALRFFVVQARSAAPAGVAPYEGTLTVEFFPSGEWVRLVVTLSRMHDEEFTKMASEGLASQFRNLDKLFQDRNK